MRDQQALDEIAEHCTKLAENVTGLTEHVRAIKEIQQILFIGLVHRSPELKDHFLTLIQHCLDHAEECSLGQRTVEALAQWVASIQNPAVSSAKNLPHLTLVWPPPPAQPRKPTDPEAP